MTTEVDQPVQTDSGPAEPPRGRSRPSRIFSAHTLEASLLPIAFVLIIAFFGHERPDTFFQWTNFTTIFGLNAVGLILVMSLLVPLTNGDLDLSIAENSGLVSILVGWLNVNHGWGIVPSIVAGLVVGLVCGIVNGWIVVQFDVNPFIITLATGSVMNGVAFWLPNQQTVPGISTKLTDWTVIKHFLGIPLDFWYGVVIMLIMGYVLTFTAFGQRSLFVGQSREVARLSGFKVGSIRFTGFAIAGLIAAISGVVNDGVLGSATPGAGNLLLSVYAAVFLGMTTIQPGRFNAIGAGISVFFLAVGVNGMNLMGAQTYVQSLFYGVILVIAVVASRLINRRRAASAARATT
ncbi:MAG TPA: ABC transporter permease [Gaiellaceae bacterium]|jgi:ribose transport system permease protein|nr:ABC transporter permease [Gaiellaceae bacterium]